MAFFKKKDKSKNEIVRRDPDHAVVIPKMSQQYYTRDPDTGELIEVQQTPQPPSQAHQPPIVQNGDDFIGFKGQMGIRYGADGSEEFVYDGYIQGKRTTRAGQQDHDYDPTKDIFWTKKRLFVGSLLVVFALMIAADIFGTPHFRSEPGIYVGLEGQKIVETSSDESMIILKRLDRSVFSHTFDGIGWILGWASELFSSDEISE